MLPIVAPLASIRLCHNMVKGGQHMGSQGIGTICNDKKGDVNAFHPDLVGCQQDTQGTVWVVDVLQAAQSSMYTYGISKQAATL
jgi:hypothetical protein